MTSVRFTCNQIGEEPELRWCPRAFLCMTLFLCMIVLFQGLLSSPEPAVRPGLLFWDLARVGRTGWSHRR
jgi:hypothetical protein